MLDQLLHLIFSLNWFKLIETNKYLLISNILGAVDRFVIEQYRLTRDTDETSNTIPLFWVPRNIFPVACHWKYCCTVFVHTAPLNVYVLRWPWGEMVFTKRGQRTETVLPRVIQGYTSWTRTHDYDWQQGNDRATAGQLYLFCGVRYQQVQWNVGQSTCS